MKIKGHDCVVLTADLPEEKLKSGGVGTVVHESHFAQSGPMTEAIILGTIAIRMPGQKLNWNSGRLQVTNVREANQYVRRTYREGWHADKF